MHAQNDKSIGVDSILYVSFCYPGPTLTFSAYFRYGCHRVNLNELSVMVKSHILSNRHLHLTKSSSIIRFSSFLRGICKYDLRDRESHIQPGDRVLVRNVWVRGKRKIADIWEKDVYLVVDQPNKDIPVYIVKREHGRGNRRMLHKNLLLPFMALPASKQDLLDTSMPTDSTQPLLVDTPDIVDNIGQDDLADTSSNDEISSADTGDSGTQTAD